MSRSVTLTLYVGADLPADDARDDEIIQAIRNWADDLSGAYVEDGTSINVEIGGDEVLG